MEIDLKLPCEFWCIWVDSEEPDEPFCWVDLNVDEYGIVSPHEPDFKPRLVAQNCFFGGGKCKDYIPTQNPHIGW